MNKPGRNDPCPCGSGRKFKKCCMEKDNLQAIVKAEETPSVEDEKPFQAVLPEAVFEEDEYDEEESDDFDDDDFNPFSPREEDDNDRISNRPYPEISAEEQKLISEWDDLYVILEKPHEIREHIRNFIDAYPHLVENLALEDEAMFVLAEGYLKKAGLRNTSVSCWNSGRDFLLFTSATLAITIPKSLLG